MRAQAARCKQQTCAMGPWHAEDAVHYLGERHAEAAATTCSWGISQDVVYEDNLAVLACIFDHFLFPNSQEWATI